MSHVQRLGHIGSAVVDHDRSGCVCLFNGKVLIRRHFPQKIRHLIGDISLGDAAQVDGCLWIGKRYQPALRAALLRHGVALHNRHPVQAAIIHMGKQFLYFFCLWHSSRLRRKIPQLRQTADGDVEQPSGQFAVVDAQLQHLYHMCISDFHWYSTCAVNAVDIAALYGPAHGPFQFLRQQKGIFD